MQVTIPPQLAKTIAKLAERKKTTPGNWCRQVLTIAAAAGSNALIVADDAQRFVRSLRKYEDE